MFCFPWMPLITTVTVEPYSYRAKLAKRTTGTLPPDARAYLGAGEGYDPAGEKVQNIHVDRLEWLLAHGMIHPAQHGAGRKLQRDCELAAASIGDPSIVGLTDAVPRTRRITCRWPNLRVASLDACHGVP